MAALAARFRRHRPGGSSAPLGVQDVRLVDSPDARMLARAAAILAAMDQALEALAELQARSRRRPPAPTGPEALIEVALLRHGVVQFVDCLDAAHAVGLLEEVDLSGLAFCRHLRAFRDELCGPHARLVGETQTVALLRRVADRPVLAGVATRTRRPGRLTAAELTQLLTLTGQVRAACAERLERLRATVLEQVRGLSATRLDSLPRAPDI